MKSIVHKQRIVVKPLDYKNCPQLGQRYLSEHSELWFKGILSYIFDQSNCFQNVHEIQMLCSSYDQKHPPFNVIMKDDSQFFITGPPQKDQFIGIRFFCIAIRPTAICIKSIFFYFPSKAHPLRSFIIVGKNSEFSDPVILSEFSYVTTLRKGGTEIFYINTDQYFDHIYIQQTCPSFDNERKFAVAQLEIHGYIKFN